MNAKPYDHSQSLGYLTIVTGRLFIATLNRHLARQNLDLTSEQWGILRFLLNEDGQTQEALLRITRYEKSTLSRLLDGMEKKGFIERKRNENDARRKTVFLTPKGAERGLEGTDISLVTLNILKESIPAKEMDICRATIERVQEILLCKLREEGNYCDVDK